MKVISHEDYYKLPNGSIINIIHMDGNFIIGLFVKIDDMDTDDKGAFCNVIAIDVPITGPCYIDNKLREKLNKISNTYTWDSEYVDKLYLGTDEKLVKIILWEKHDVERLINISQNSLTSAYTTEI